MGGGVLVLLFLQNVARSVPTLGVPSRLYKLSKLTSMGECLLSPILL